MELIRSPFHFTGNKKRAIKNGLLKAFGNKQIIDAMVGSGAVLYNVGGMGYDIDPLLIMMHKSITLPGFIEYVRNIWHNDFVLKGSTDNAYYAIRDIENSMHRDGVVSSDRAAYLYVLTQLSFNSLWRFGPNGYNVPFGWNRKKVDFSRISDAAKRSAELGLCFSTADALSMPVTSNMVIYFDPPYLSSNYNYGTWSSKEEVRLRDRCVKAHEAGTQFVMSNVGVYRGRFNYGLIKWAHEHKFNVHSIDRVSYNKWASAVDGVSHSTGTREIIITNRAVEGLPIGV